ncbi:MAG: histidine phosphatase family protein [Clostridiales bacterium]|nr:histidine phosphatase family protein [Clostridiales bacterium]
MLKIIYFVHGTSTDNEEHRSSGWHDCPLSDLGVSQTIQAKNNLICKQFDIVFSSDLSRARQTAGILFPKLDVVFDERLRECNYGVLNGSLGRRVKYEEHIKTPFPEGESLLDVQARITAFLHENLEKNDNKVIAIISHRAPQLALDVIVKKYSWSYAIKKDWRINGNWMPGWEYIIDDV